MKDLIKALTILQKYMDENNQFPTHCGHDVMYVHGVHLHKMDAATVHELIELGFNPGSDDDTDYDWDNFTQEDWEERWPFLADCFYSYKYGSC